MNKSFLNTGELIVSAFLPDFCDWNCFFILFCSQVEYDDEYEEEYDEAAGPSGSTNDTTDPIMMKNTNAADVAALAKERREQAKMDSKAKKDKDKLDREKQKQLREEKKEKRKTVKGERKR